MPDTGINQGMSSHWTFRVTPLDEPIPTALTPYRFLLRGDRSDDFHVLVPLKSDDYEAVQASIAVVIREHGPIDA
jgi:hypothetical protein